MTDTLLFDTAAIPLFPPLPALLANAHPDVLLGPVRPELIRAEVLADLLEATAARVPEKTALIFGERQLTYRAAGPCTSKERKPSNISSNRHPTA